MAYFFVNPFGVDGDRAAVPTAGSSSGSMSYEFGFTPNYELDLGSDPAALPIPRNQNNQLYFDITTAIQQYQTHAIPDWITSVDNLGSPYPYEIYALVRYDAGGGIQVYENQVAANVATPGADATWRVVSGGVQGVVPGTVIDFAGPVAPIGYLNCDGSAISRSTYVELLSSISFTQTGTTTNTVNTLTGLSTTAYMYVGMPLEGTGITAGTTVASITNATDIVMSAVATASGSVPVTFYPWGNGNGTTTFNLPDLRRSVTMGSGGSASTDPLGIGNVVGQDGGEEGHVQTVPELATHLHSITMTSAGGNPTIPWGASGVSPASQNTVTNGSSQAFNIIQPSAIMNKCIKT